MISEIQINAPVATYQNITKLTDLRRINYIFGANGTGKTTISRVISRAVGHEHCLITWQGGIELQCMVYNRDFVEQNFSQENPLQGVFTLGENQVEAEYQIASLKPEIEKTNNQILSLNNQLIGEDGRSGKNKELDTLESVLKERCWKQKQLHDEYFQVAFIGVRNSAERFKDKVLAEQESNSAELCSLEELKEKTKTVFSSKPERIALIANVSADTFITLQKNALLQKAIVGEQDVDIAALIDHLGNSDWVKQGRQYHEQQPDTCPFCQQATDKQFTKDLAAFFSEAYDNDIKALKALQANYHQESEQLLLTIQGCLESGNPFLNIELLSVEVEVLTERLKINHDILARKIEQPSHKFKLEPIESLITKLQGFIIEANEATNTYNQTVANIVSERRILTSKIWRYVLNELKADIQHYEQTKIRLISTIEGMNRSLTQKRSHLRDMNEQLKELEKYTTSIRPTIAAINDLLMKFGFNSFSLGETDDGRYYRIIRANGDDASRSLSEGEKTFITFLYFYHLIKGAQSPSGITVNRVVVFDDPISSLDSDILYIVSSLIKGVMEEIRDPNSQIKQVFVLTHNVYFHKEISFNRSRPIDRLLTEESFWQVKKLQQGSVVERCEENPVRSAYELLWDDVKSDNISSISLQNTLRRILENYFTMWGGMGKDEICNLFEGRDKLICQSLFSWINDGSHSIHDDLYINHGEQTNEAYLRVFRDIFDKAGQIGHYNMMKGISFEPVAAQNS
ncbi:AAA family ATPase [Proteus mirabilis]|uniref:AAA family ATPase n=3 Tax=Gammaproteobacteria TaxID=1236 RepID=UPI00217D59E6|nr:AAA family ATPase [Proteus mirabilis]MCS6723905.1 AAA family ATPase [Proteus mirabilis]